MSHNSLAEYYKIAYTTFHHHGWALNDLENMIVFERDLYLDLLIDELQRQKEEAERLNRA